MLALAEIESAVEHLPRQEFSSFSAWFEKCEAERWDKEIEKDIDIGLLEISKRLNQQGVNITEALLNNFFEFHGILKKTRDSQR